MVLDSKQDRSIGLSRVAWIVDGKASAFRFALFLDISSQDTSAVESNGEVALRTEINQTI